MILRMVPQRTEGDCTIVALAMFLGENYEDVLAMAAASQDFQVHHDGMYNRQVKQVAECFGVHLVEKHKWDEEEADGILSLKNPKTHACHVVVLRYGLIFDGDLGVWEPSVYYQHTGYKAWGILIRKEKK